MEKPIIESEGISKVYQLGEIGASSLREELNRFWRTMKGEKDLGPTGDFWALKNVDFQINHGEVVGVIGRNGAGKSTLLKVISRITEPTFGSITLRGRVAALLEVGTGFHPELTGRENIYLNGTILGMRKNEIDRKLDEIIDFSGMEVHIDTPVKRYSSGMNVRLGFAVAAHLEPEILIIDEVLAVGDANFQKKCLGKMQNVASQGRTVLFVSHNMPMIQNLCTRSILLRDGQVAMDGTTADTVRAYLNDGVSQLGNTQSLLEFPRAHGFEKMLSKLQLNGSTQPNTVSVEMGESITAELEISATRELRDAGFRMVIETSDGIPVSTLNSYYYDQPEAWNLKEGSVTFEFSTQNLIPGDYFVTVTCSEERRRMVDCVERCLNFSVAPSKEISTGYRMESKWGVAYIPSKIGCHKLN